MSWLLKMRPGKDHPNQRYPTRLAFRKVQSRESGPNGLPQKPARWAAAKASQVGYALRTFSGAWTMTGTRCVPYNCEE